MGHAVRIGLKVFDPLEILQPDGLRRGLLLVDKMAFDEAQLKRARDFAELSCVLHHKDPGSVLRRFDEDWQQLDKLGRLEPVLLGEAVPSEQMGQEIQRLEHVALRELEKRQPYQVTLANGRKTMIHPAGSYVLNKTAADVLRARCLAAQLSSAESQVLPFITGPVAEHFIKGSRDATVLRVVLSNVPVPDAEMELSSIVEFVARPDVSSKLTRLRSWMVDMAVSPMTEEQMQTKLENALSEYTDTLALRQRKATTGTIELLVTTTVEVLENVVRLKLSEAVKKIFQLFKEDCSLTEAELSAPGRELAFIDSVSALRSHGED